ncbi:DUF4157 domain-containing protein [Algoriphagus sp. D3-2-R+10]|uniref:eCIS core domain-containing protein n=1 Tax=Algoriphagus aurantiacus TaxID=3103948 RepID=UPI002B36F14A|nr:DUF4157 domain-containing protein [Algoriphagus sp. D3-2-R+10]MEB2773764.1 DUF4157 domain-containing protein [Algoriphagus sp. D3-2-R+10]
MKESKEQSKSSSSLKEKMKFSFFSPTQVQAKLKVNTPGDPYEQEADAIANQVVSPQGSIDSISRKENLSGIQTTQNNPLQGQKNRTPSPVNNSIRTTGKPIENEVRESMETSFGQDFSNVRIHRDGPANKSADEINAKAYTFQNDIVFGKGQYQPQSFEGKKLLAHELTHVAQGTKQIQRDPDEDAEKVEQDKIAKLKSSIKAAFSLKSVEDGSSNWTSEELRITKEGLEMIPKADISALKDVVLKRVNSLGGETAGQFGSEQSVDDTTVTNEYELEIADLNFSSGSTEAEQKRLVQHEVGHAIASLPSRKANLAANVALAKLNEKVNQQNDSADPFNTANDEFNDAVTDYNSKADEYNNESDASLKKQLKSDLDALKKIVEQKRKVRTKKETEFNSAEGAAKKAKTGWEKKDKEAKKHNIDQSDLDTIKKNSDSAKTDHDTALASSKGKITTEMTDLDEAKQYATSVESLSTEIDSFYTETKDQDKSESEVETLIVEINKLIETRGQAFEALSKKDGSHPLLTILPSFEKYQDTFFHMAKANALAHERSARVQKFVEFVEANNIQPISDYARKNWPHKPEEFYAEAYSFWVSNKLNTISPELQKWFDGKKYK